MTILNNEITLHHVMMEAFMPAYGKKAVELAHKLGDIDNHQQYAACVAIAWPVVYRMTQAGITETVVDTGELGEYTMSFMDRNYQFLGSEFITIENILSINEQLGVWELIDNVIHLKEEMLEISRKKAAMAAREAGTTERTPRDIAKIGNWGSKATSPVKGADKAMRISRVAKDAQNYLEAQEFTINATMLKIINGLKLKEYRGTVAQCYTDFTKTLIQQCDFDARGRIYYMAYNAPHPASDDIRTSLYKMVTDQAIQIGSKAHDAYLAELDDIGFKEKHQYKRMAMEMDIASADADGWYIPSQPVGLDAKSSGAQIYSILMGDAKLGRMCGLTSEYTPDQKINDPYSVTARILSSKLNKG